jgi:hypothetical protein
VSDRLQTFANRFLGRADGVAVVGGKLLQTDTDTLTANTSTGATVPVYTTFPLSVSLTTTLASSLLYIYAYVSWNFGGGAPVGSLRTANFRFRRNAVLIPASRATSQVTVRGQLCANSFSRLLLVTAGLHTIDFQWAKQLGSGTLSCSPATLPDIFGANLKVQEFAP